MKLVTSEQMRQIDRSAIDDRGIPSPELMENAGRGIAFEILSQLLLDTDTASFAIFCGKGNNGGDGFVVGRYLHNAGYDVVIYHLGVKSELSPDAQLNYEHAEQLNFPLNEINSIENLPDILETDFIIDAIFGTGFSAAPRGIAKELIEYINEQPQPVIAIDMPSGLNADNGNHEGEVVHADFTFTLAQPKYGLFVSPGREMSGDVTVVPIGIPDEVVESFDLYNRLITSELIQSILPIRPPDGHKGTFGKLLMVCGSTGMTGAAVLAARSALRTGCGMLKVACPHTLVPIINSGVIEATVEPLPDVKRSGKLALRGLGQLREITSEHEAVVIGPGLGQHHETKELVIRYLLGLTRPAVVDADGLNALTNELSVLEDSSADLVLTPHPGEFYRLSGEKPPDDIHERIALAREFALKYQQTLVLKGSPTLVAHHDGTVWLNPTGNNGMATGGSGDVLSGTIGSFLAQGMSSIDAALTGVYVHGLAGDIATLERGERSVIATDLILFLSDALLSLD